MKIERRKAIIALLFVVVVAVMGAVILNAYSTANACQPINSSGDMQGWFGWGGFGFAEWTNGNVTVEKPAIPRGWMRGRGCFNRGFIEVSEEYKENVISIAKNDADVQNLLNDGYNITSVKPIIKMVVEGDGTVATKATTAIVVLEKDTAGRAMVWVDLEQGKVTKIAILTLTIIEKP
ncbi:MAG: hypothetical protein QW660_09200 [Candidatus Bathyarchaeia archaeon]